MKLIAVDQRVMEESRYEETRDALDQRWTDFLDACGFIAVPVPNHLHMAQKLLLATDVAGVLLTGGSSHPRRDATTQILLNHAATRNLPVIGVCHGMQAMQQASGVTLTRVENHVMPQQSIHIDGKPVLVNSYHEYGAKKSAPELDIWAVAPDGVVKAVRNQKRRWLGMMWHPERMSPFAPRDIEYFKEWFA